MRTKFFTKCKKKKRKDIDNIALSFTTTCINTSNKVLSFVHN